MAVEAGVVMTPRDSKVTRESGTFTRVFAIASVLLLPLSPLILVVFVISRLMNFQERLKNRGRRRASALAGVMSSALALFTCFAFAISVLWIDQFLGSHGLNFFSLVRIWGLLWLCWLVLTALVAVASRAKRREALHGSPGAGLLEISAFLYSKRTCTRVFEPLVGQLQEDCNEAWLEQGQRGKTYADAKIL